MKPKDKPQHVLITTPKGKLSMECKNCHSCEIQFMPQDQNAAQGFIDYFIKRHTECKLSKKKK